MGLISLIYNSLTAYFMNTKLLGIQGTPKETIISACMTKMKKKAPWCNSKLEDYIVDKTKILERSTGNIKFGLFMVFLGGIVYLSLYLWTEKVK